MNQKLALSDLPEFIKNNQDVFSKIRPKDECTFILNNDGLIVSAMGEYRSLLSYNGTSPNGQNFRSLFDIKYNSQIDQLFCKPEEERAECFCVMSDQENNPNIIGITCYKNPAENTMVVFIRGINNFLINQIQLSESEKNYRTLFHNSPLPNIIYEMNEFKILEANEQAARHFGLSMEQLKSSTLMDIRPSEELDVVRYKHSQIDANASVINFGVCTFQNTKKDVLKMDVTGMRIRYNGQDCMITEYLDVTESEQNISRLKSSEERYRALQESLTSYMVRVDLTGRYSYVNKKFKADFVPDGTEIIGMQANEILMDYHMARLQETVMQCIQSPGKVIQVELDKPDIHGHVKHTLWEFLCLQDDHGYPSEIQCVGLDITERKKIEAELQNSNERYNTINLVTKDAIYEWDLINNDLMWGPGLERIFGHEKLSIHDWEKQLHPQEKHTVVDSLNKFLESPSSKIWKQEYRLKRTDLTYAIVEEIGHLERDEQGKPVRMIGVLRDVTDTRALERMLKTATTMSRLGAFEAIYEDNYHLWSPMAREIFEFEEEDIITNEKIMDSHRGKWKEQLQAGLNRLLVSPASDNFELPIVTKSGKEKWLSITIQSEKIFGGKTKIFGSFQDITDRKNAELRLKSLANNVPGVLYQYRLGADGSEELTLVSNKSTEIWGYEPEAVMKNPGLIWKGLEKGGKIKEAQKSIQESREHLTPIRVMSPYVQPDGSRSWHELYGQPRKLSDGSVLWNSIVLDVTKEHEARILAESVKKIAKLGSWEIAIQKGTFQRISFDSSYHDILESDPEGDYGVDDLLKLTFPKYKSRVVQLLENLMTKGQKEELEAEIETFKGEYKWVKVIGQGDFINGHCVRIYGSLQDITQTKQFEIDLSNKTKYLAALAQISSELLELEKWDETLDTCLRIAGNTVRADRVYFFENHHDKVTGDDLCSQRYEWVKGNINPEIDNPELQNLPHHTMGTFFDPLREGLPFKATIEELPDGYTKDLLSSQEILSILILPVFIADEFVGFIGFDDCTRKHQWSKDEEHFLKSIADNIASAIQRYHARTSLQKALVEKESILNNIRDGFTELDHDYIVYSWNPRAAQITGFSTESMVGKSIWDAFGPDVKEHFLKIAESQKNSSVIIYEQYYKTLGKYIEVNVYPSEIGYSIFFRDITEKRLAENELRASEEKYRVLIESSDAAIMMVDREGVFQYMNEVAERPFLSNPNSPFYHRKTLAGLQTEELFPPDQAKWMRAKLDKVLETNHGDVSESEILIAGQNLWYRNSLQPVRNAEGKPIAALIVSNNITESKIADQKIRKSEEQYRVLVESLDSVICTVNEQGIFTFINHKAATVLQIAPQNVIGKHHGEFITKLGSPHLTKSIRQVFETGKGTVDDSEMVIGRRNHWFQVQVLPIKDSTGKTIEALIKSNDITDQKQAEKLIISNERKYRFLFEESPYALLISKGAIFMEVNKAAERMFGYSSDEMRSLNPRDFSPEMQPNGRRSEDMVDDMVAEVMKKGTHEFDWMHQRKGGHNFMCRVTLNKAIYENEEVLFAMIRDVTDTIRAESEMHKFREIVDQANYGTAIIENGIIQYSNQAMANMHHLSLDELIGKNYLDLIPDEMKQAVADVITNDTDIPRDIQSAEGIHIRRDGSKFPVIVNLKEIYTKLNQRIMSISVIDLSELQRIRAENRQLNIAIEQSPVAMVVTDLNSTIEYCSPAFTAITGFEPEEVIGKKISVVKSGLTDPSIYKDLWSTLSQGKVWEGQFINKRKDGTLYYELDTISPILNDQGVVTHYLGIKQDITDTINYQNSLKALNEELETQKKELELSNKELEQFAYVASHDLQEPLRMVTSFMTQLEKKYKDVLDEKGQQYIYFAVDGAKRMRRIILDLLDYSRVGRMNDELTTINLNDMMVEVEQLQNKLIEETGAQILFNDLPTIKSFYSPVLQIFHNLVSNALKYRAPDRAPIIEISFEETTLDWIFSVKDNGIGIPEEYFQKIFVIFQRLQTPNTAEGTGMGLAIVKKHVENLDGHITVSSIEGEGSVFTFTIKKLN